jgi:hypothetical protein
MAAIAMANIRATNATKEDSVEKLFDQTRIAACKVCAPHFFVL